MTRIWDSYAHETDPAAVARTGNEFVRYGDERTLLMNNPAVTPVPVTLSEDPAGVLRGWVPAGQLNIVMVEDHRIFGIQFPAGADAAVANGDGEIVNLTARRRHHNETDL